MIINIDKVLFLNLFKKLLEGINWQIHIMFKRYFFS